MPQPFPTSVKKGLDASVPGKSMELNFILRDANGKQVAEQKATTDEYGTASVDFELPKEGQTGLYFISVNGTVSKICKSGGIQASNLRDYLPEGE